MTPAQWSRVAAACVRLGAALGEAAHTFRSVASEVEHEGDRARLHDKASRLAKLAKYVIEEAESIRCRL